MADNAMIWVWRDPQSEAIRMSRKCPTYTHVYGSRLWRHINQVSMWDAYWKRVFKTPPPPADKACYQISLDDAVAGRVVWRRADA